MAAAALALARHGSARPTSLLRVFASVPRSSARLSGSADGCRTRVASEVGADAAGAAATVAAAGGRSWQTSQRGALALGVRRYRLGGAFRRRPTQGASLACLTLLLVATPWRFNLGRSFVSGPPRLPMLRPRRAARHAAAAAAGAGVAGFDFSAVDVRVGEFVKVWHHEGSEKLFCELIDVGEAEPRQIVSGLRPYYSLEDLEGRRCLVLCNLKAAKLAGVQSSGMVLCGSTEERSTVELLDPPAGAPVGERVVVEGMEGAPLSPNAVKKKKAWESIQPDLAVVDGVATFRGKPLLTSAGPVVAPTVKGGAIS